MDLTQEQINEIAAVAVEQILNKMPEVIGNLMATHATNTKLKDEFLNKYSEFKDHLDVVRQIVEKEDSKKLGQDYNEVLENSVPKIRKQIGLKTSLNTIDVKEASDLSFTLQGSDNGEL